MKGLKMGVEGKFQKITIDSDSRIGIVNRGEPAIRFIRAVKEYNFVNKTQLQTVVFYLPADAEALYVKEADNAFALHEMKRFQSIKGSAYLDHELLLEALQTYDCQAVWPGWGFVSEDALFVRKLEEKGIVFIGPSSEAMFLLGDKIAAKKLAEKASVPTAPWVAEPVLDMEQCKAVAEVLGYPLIIKAANAGGGRGIRIVYEESELERQFHSAREETLRITGNTILFIEYFVSTARHLEVQALADRFGNVHTFGVRDCSVQRRNQKIIEETPPPRFNKKTLKEMEAAAARLISMAGYENAGTVEFIYDVKKKQYFFMEVNTRLQVEHPITETLYTADLVQYQIDVVMGKKLTKIPHKPHGVAIEVRLNAEDPDRQFTPSPGKVLVFQPPTGHGIRVDSGIETGSDIPSEFDSMVAKIIAHGATRTLAIGALQRALSEMRIKIEQGTTNRAFLSELLALKEIQKGGVHTRFVEEYLKKKKDDSLRNDWDVAVIVAVIQQYQKQYEEELANFRQKCRHIGPPRITAPTQTGEITQNLFKQSYTFIVKEVAPNHFHLVYEGKIIAVRFYTWGEESILVHNRKRYTIQTVTRGDTLQCEVNGKPYFLEMEAQGTVRAPSPAIIIAIAAKPGQEVKKGKILLTLEAMKMEMVITAPADGIVKKVAVRDGEQITAGQPLIELDMSKHTEDDDIGEYHEKIDFTRFIMTEGPAGTMVANDDRKNRHTEFIGFFLGFDCESPEKLLDQIVTDAHTNALYLTDVVTTIASGLLRFIAIERLFSTEKIKLNGEARATDYHELLLHFFLRSEERGKGLPDEFLNHLKTVLKFYQCTEESDFQTMTTVFHRLYSSHTRLERKMAVLKKALEVLERIWPDSRTEVNQEQIASLLSDVSFMARPKSPSLADTALHARYQLIDRHIIKMMKDEKREAIGKSIDELLKNDSATEKTIKKLQQQVSDAGHKIVADLLFRSIAASNGSKALLHELLGRRYNRDRTFVSGQFIENEDSQYYLCQTKSKKGVFSSVLVLIHEKDLIHTLTRLQKALEKDKIDETIILVAIEQKTSRDWFNNLTDLPGLNTEGCCIGIFDGDYNYLYRTYTTTDGVVMHEKVRKRFLNPLVHRELHVERLINFDLTVRYCSENVLLYHGQAFTNNRDERLFALVEVPEAKPEFTRDNKISRLVAFDNAFLEAVNAMRAEQASRKRRLYWNRIFISIHEPLEASLDQIRDYADKIAHQTRGLGLEKVVVYTRMRHRGKLQRIEFIFENLSGNLFRIRYRRPSSDALLPLDDFTSKVVRAKQRGTVYPHQIIRIITRGGPENEPYLGGNFEELDVTYDEKNGQYKAVPASTINGSRQISNIVFGYISNFREHHRLPLKRVLIMGDPTRDMGALGEAECSRINAAIDCAEADDLPVEWVAVSAGARIDMDSGTENLDWTARTLRRIIEFTQKGGEINIIVPGINVGAQSYWNAEATMLMHTRGLLIMTDEGSMLLTGKKALDISGSVSAEDNAGIGGAEKIMAPNGQVQVRAKDLPDAYRILFRHYDCTYAPPGTIFPERWRTTDSPTRNVCLSPYTDLLEQGFSSIGDILGFEKNPERKKPFDMRQVMEAIIDQDFGYFERWKLMQDAETAIVWETRIGGYATGLLGIESKPLARVGLLPNDGPEAWNGGTLFPQSSKKIARALNAFSNKVPVVVLANLSGFDGSPESLRNLQLEYGAEIGRAVVNFRGPIIFVVIARYHGGAYVVFSQSLNPHLKAVALEHTFASVIGGGPAAAVVFPRQVMKDAATDPRIIEAKKNMSPNGKTSQKEYNALFQDVYAEKQIALAQKFDSIHSVERAKKVGSIEDIIKPQDLRSFLISAVEEGMNNYLESHEQNHRKSLKTI